MASTTSTSPQDFLVQHMAAALRAAIDEVSAPIIAAASAQIEKDLRAKVGGIAAQVASTMSYERMGTDLVIRVKFDK